VSVLEFVDVKKVLKSGFLRRPVYTLGPLTLEVMPGEIFGYLGPNGAGKTTSIKVAMGILRADSGEVRFFGERAGRREVKRRVGFLPEHPYFYRHLTAFEVLDFYGELFGMDARSRRRRASDLLDLTGLAEAADTRLSRFSKGMLQRVGLAQALMNDPELVILDEPLSGLDPAGRRQIRDLILGLRSEGKTVFFSSHILQDVEMICDRVGILMNGKLLRAVSMEDVLSQTLSYVEVGVDALGVETVRRLGFNEVETKAGRVIVRLGPDEDPGDVMRVIAEAGGRISSVVPQRQTLEDYFMENVTPDAARDGAPAVPRGRPGREAVPQAAGSGQGAKPTNRVGVAG